MKTNQILTRQMGDFAVNQRTCDGMFNATELLKQWNNLNATQKKLDHFFENKTTNEFISTIIDKENLDARNSVYVKSRASRGSNAGTWMHPLLFIDFAMWINAEFKYDVLKFVYDQLIQYRNEAGDSYIRMSAAISKLVPKSLLQNAIQNVSRANNHIVFGNHERNIRNKKAEEKSMQELVKIQDKITELVEDGFIPDYNGLMRYLRQQWAKKYQPKFLTA